MLDKLAPPAEETARETSEAWIGAFGAALARGDERALSSLFAHDSHRRNLFGLSWRFATFGGTGTLAREFPQCAGDVCAEGFRIIAPQIDAIKQGRLEKRIETRD